MDGNSAPDTRRGKQCDVCSRRFSRSEHLARHRRTHTKERPFACPHCYQFFQRSDVRALHLKNCHGTSSETPHESIAAGRSLHKRVGIACVSCRKRKMRCDGYTPCAPCRSTTSTCVYAPATRSTRSLQPTHEAVINQSAKESVSTTEESSPSFTLSRSRLDSDSSSAADLGFLQDVNQIQFSSATEAQESIRVSSEAAPNELELSTSSENVFHSFIDTSSMNDIWQTPAINSPFWFDTSDLTWSEGIFDASSLVPDHTLSSSLQNTTTLMQEYFDRKSRAPSPTLNKASVMWYSAPPNLEDHDKDVLNVFSNLFDSHIPKTFPLFNEVTVGQKIRAEYYLAMAAIGGLFCSVPGCLEVAKSMYNDARRLFLAYVKCQDPLNEARQSRQDKLSVVKTFILLELYGLCSGDKRSYEFVEAFHGDLTQAVQEYSQACQLPSSEEVGREIDDVRLFESLCVLDCYRIIIMQRPPSMSWCHVNSFTHSPSTDSRTTQLLRQIAVLTSPTHSTDFTANTEYSLASLAALSAHLWPALFSSSNRYSNPSVGTTNHSLWKADFVELACDTWLRMVGTTVTSSSLAVYHMMNIMLHANLPKLQCFAHSPPESDTRDPNKSSTGREIFAWLHDRHYVIARWHAEKLIDSIESTFVAPMTRLKTQGARMLPSMSSSSSTEPARLPFETPHVPYAIYYATLILWCGTMTDSNTCISAASARAYLVKGEQILSLHRVHIAQLLACVLKEVA